VALGQRLQDELASAFATGASASDVVAGLTGLDGATATSESFADFTRIDPPENFPPAAIGSLEGLKAGAVSDMVLFSNEGLLTHAASRAAPQLDSSDERYIELHDQLAAVNAASTASGTVQALIAAELDTGDATTN
jgi:hypothetical protein